MRAIIVSNGSFDIETFKKHKSSASLIVCADGGANHLYKSDVVPDMIIGDLDSIETDILDYYKKENVLFNKFPSEKNCTDTELAINFAIQNGADEVILFGSTGTRLDHTLGNIMLLYKLLKQGIKATIIDETNEIYITDKKIEMEKDKDTFVSLIPLSDPCEGITLSGFKYSTNDLNLSFGSTMGISNEVENERASINIKNGISLVIKSKDK